MVLFFTGYQWSCTGASETYVTPEGSKKCKLEKPDIKVKKADKRLEKPSSKAENSDAENSDIEVKKSTTGQIYLRSRSLLCYVQIVVEEISPQFHRICQKACLYGRLFLKERGTADSRSFQEDRICG